MVDDHFRLKLLPSTNFSDSGSKSPPPSVEATIKDVFALGDVAVMEKNQLPATAQVASQEAIWVAKRLNAGDIDKEGFNYKNLGIMTYLGNMKAIMQTENNTEIKGYVYRFPDNTSLLYPSQRNLAMRPTVIQTNNASLQL